MKIYKYSITLYTQMGEKNGTLTRYTECGSYSEKGFIEILGEKNPYLARVEPCGKCSMSGTLKTIVSDHKFSGSGYIYPDKLELTLYSGRSSLIMKGEIKEVSFENEKVL